MLKYTDRISDPEELRVYRENAAMIINASDIDGLLWFDIETTGLSASSSYLYEIGTMYLKDSSIVLEQFFSEGPSDEADLLSAFNEQLKCSSHLVHFNGQTFDIPYITSKCEAHGLENEIQKLKSIDLFRTLKPLKNVLGMNSAKQKAFESVVGIKRRDRFDGGELISVYNKYIATKRLEQLRSKAGSSYIATGESGLSLLSDQAGRIEASRDLLNLLLLHNYEDVHGMLKISSLLSLCRMFEGHFTLTDITVGSEEVIFSLSPLIGALPSFTLSGYVRSFAKPFIFSSNGGKRASLSVPIFDTELKLFYPDYKNYWYLPAEDYAVHCSVGDFLDRSVKKKATASTAYTRCHGCFIALPFGTAPENMRLFRTGERKDSFSYIQADDAQDLDLKTVSAYLSMLL